MSPLQKIAMGLVIVLVPAPFPAHPDPEWAFYDALPDPIGWLMVLAGIRTLRAYLDLDVVTWLGALAFLVSVPLWFPQINHLFVPEYNDAIDASLQWLLFLPQVAFCLMLARTIGQEAATRQPPDTYAASRFGVLVWGFSALIVLPPIAFGGGVDRLVKPTYYVIFLVNAAFIYFLFRVHRRGWLGGPGPLEIHPARQRDS